MLGQWHLRQVLRAAIAVLIIAAAALLSLNSNRVHDPSISSVKRQQPSHCPEISDLLQRIHELSALQENIGVKNCEILREANIAALGRMGVNVSHWGDTPKPEASPIETPVKKPPEPTQYKNEAEPHNVLLDPDFVPNNVIYVWCGRRWFEFQHYLSVKSVIRELRPDNIIFYYNYEPVVDSWTYNTWFSELQKEYPFFRLFHMNADFSAQACKEHAQPNLDFILARLTEMGGMYVNENTLLTNFPHLDRKFAIIDALNHTDLTGYIMARRGYPGTASLQSLIKDTRFETKQVACVQGKTFSGGDPNCMNLGYGFFPKDIWEADTPFARIIRRIFYGNPEVNLPKQDYGTLIPNIAHMVWLGGGKMDFLFYLGVLSLIYVAEVDMVYIHGDAPPSGEYWNRVRHHPKLTLVYRQNPITVYGTRVDVLSHVTDVWRVDFMVKYGGIYVDTDTVFTKKLDRDIRAYDAVGAYDWTYWNHPFPDTINFGVAIGKKNAKYWHLFQESMKWFMDKDWSWNGLRQPYRIKERHPELVRIDPALQVICFESLCHPTWYPDYHNESAHHLNDLPIKDWRNQVYAFHWTLPTPVELQSPDNLLMTNSMFAEIGQTVLEKAGLIDQFRKEMEQKKHRRG